jgi:hypothetical protein
MNVDDVSGIGGYGFTGQALKTRNRSPAMATPQKGLLVDQI